MLNPGIRTDAADLAHWVLRPDASAADIVEAMRLPADVSIETLTVDEIRATAGYHRAWSELADLDMAELFLRNTACKRALYLSAPIVLPDTIPVEKLQSKGINTRIHVYPAADVRETIRLEAVSSYRVAGFLLRYALSIQYAEDTAGLGWQVIRPVVILDADLLAAVRDAGPDATADLRRMLLALERIVLFGSHDYLHATVLNWFPPVRGVAPEYMAIMTERVRPEEVARWQDSSEAALPQGLVPGRHTPGMAALELYSLVEHGRIIARLWETDPGIRAEVHAMVADFAAVMEALLARDLFAATTNRDGHTGAEATEDAAEYLTTVAGWFLASGLPLGTERFEDVVAGLPAARTERVRRRLAETHEGMFDFIRFFDPDGFPWEGGLVPVGRVGAEYEQAMRLPSLREHLRYLRAPRTGGGPSWIEVLAAALPAAERDRAVAALAAVGDPDSGDPGRLVGDAEALAVLRRLSRPDDAADRAAGPPPKETRYARAILASLVVIADALRAEPAMAG